MIAHLFSHLNYLSYIANAITIPLTLWNWQTKWQEHKASKIIKITIPITYGENDFKKQIEQITCKVVNLEACLDFSIWNDFSSKLLQNIEFAGLLDDAKKLNNVRIPIYKKTEYGKIDCFSYLVISVKDSNCLKFSRGGSGVIQLFLNGKFRVERRAYSGPSVEYTLREVS